MRLSRLLTDRGESVIGLIRNPEHAKDIEATGATPTVTDLEHATVDEIAHAIRDTDAVVFAAGAGPGSGAARKLTMDRDGAIKLLEATRRAGTKRYMMVSSIGAEAPPPPRGDEDEDVFSVYLRAKAEADEALAASDRDWTIVRPGRLTDDPGTGRVRLQADPFRDEVPRDDVAAVLAHLLHDQGSIHRILYLNRGDDPIA
jgi:nucleoside-diphosphate-sugar epimerase